MTEEEMAKEYVDTLLNKDDTELDKFLNENLRGLKLNEKQAGTILGVIKGVGICSFLAGLKAGEPKWHKVADGDLPKGGEYGENNIHRNIYIKDRYGNLYTGNYFPKDKTHAEDCFAVEVLEWGFQGSQFCKKEQISEWCEIPQFKDKE